MTNIVLDKLEIVLTRAAHQIGTSAQSFENLGAKVIKAPSIRLIEPPPPNDRIYQRGRWMVPKSELSRMLWRFDWIIFTSVNAVNFAELAWRDIGGLKSALAYEADVDDLRIRQRKIACIGKSTKDYLNHLGIHVDVSPKHFHAEALLVALQSKLSYKDLKQQRILIPRALVAREILPKALRAMGVEVWITPLYQTLNEQLTPACKQTICHISNREMSRVIIFTSNSTMKGFISQFSETELNLIKKEYDTFVIGPVIKKAAIAEGFRVVSMAHPHNMSGLIKAVINYYSKGEA